MRGLRALSSSLSKISLVAVAVAASALPAAASSGSSPAPEVVRVAGFQGEEGLLPDYDRRGAPRRPSARQRSHARRLGVDLRWNAFGTPQSMIRHNGYIATGLPADPVRAALSWLRDNRVLFRLSERGLRNLELINDSELGRSGAHVLLFRQRFGDLSAAFDGLINVGVRDGKIAYASSSSAGDGNVPGPARISPLAAVTVAARDVGFPGEWLADPVITSDLDWDVITFQGLSHPARARLRALPTRSGGVRPVYETLVVDLAHGEPAAWVHYVDAVTGAPWFRESRVDYAEPPMWNVFPANPRPDYATKDTREMWCWAREDAGDPDCLQALVNKAAMAPYDVDPRSSAPTFTTIGNDAISASAWVSPLTPAEQYRPVSPTRTYDFPWTNQWYESNCNPSSMTSPQRNDIDAAVTNLFVMHSRMHDWAYHLGFTEATYNLQQYNERVEDEFEGEENDPEIGNAQAGAASGGQPAFLGRDNANQITPQDGVPPITNMYLWQPVAGAFYGPCVDGDYDMSVIGHEYTHAISNRMVAGPDAGISGAQSGAMGEAWSDLVAVEYLNEFSLVPVGSENPFAVGVYVTGDPESAIRNYGMNHSPLNYSDVGYDITGPQVHADGEIWSAINYRIRKALVEKYNARFPAGDDKLQEACAMGRREPDRCPGNRRWIQIVFDAWLLMQSQVSMVDSRDAYLGADKLRFKGANKETLWRVFANLGLGQGVKSSSASDPDPIPSFTPAYGPSTEVTFTAVSDDGAPKNVQFFVGDYHARVMPVADTDPSTPLPAKAVMAPGRYDLLARADGFGMVRFSRPVGLAPRETIKVAMDRNLASIHSGGKIRAADGLNATMLIDDSEATNWASIGAAGTASEPGSVGGRQVTIDLTGGIHTIDYIQASAMLRPSESGNPDTGSQNRFSALRQFAIYTCIAKDTTDCLKPGDFEKAYTSPADAFPAIPPRPKAPHLIMRRFDIPDTRATHVRFLVLHSQCSGARWAQGDQDDDPLNDSDCDDARNVAIPSQAENVRAAELQVFAR